MTKRKKTAVFSVIEVAKTFLTNYQFNLEKIMAVDVMHLSTLSNGSPGHSAFLTPGHKTATPETTLGQKERSRSSQDLSNSAAYSPSRLSAGGDSLSASELSWSGSPEEHQAVERIHRNRKQLEDEIDVS